MARNAFDTQPLACVMGSMDLIRPLGLAGIACAAVAPPGSPPTHSRFVRAVIPWTDFWEGTESLVEALVRFGAAQSEPPVLFYEEDSQLLLVSRHRDRLATAFRFAVADAELVESLVDKGRFLELAERHGLPVPATRRVQPAADPRPPDLGLRLPVVVKPLVRDQRWSTIGGAGKAVLAETPLALQALWPRLSAAGIDLLVQELIPGPETRMESYHVYVDERGEIVKEFTGRKIRTFPLSLGHSTALTISDAADVAALGRASVQRLGLRGVAKVDFKRGPDGTLHLLEINPRFNLWHHLGAVAGVNLPALVYADLAGLPRTAMLDARAGATWCRPLDDWRAARASGISTVSWTRWMLRCEANASFDPRDPMPCLSGEVYHRARRMGGGWLRRLRRPATAAAAEARRAGAEG
jgi:predicted ATP-grasp superfamily ATP-dependent carboligase